MITMILFLFEINVFISAGDTVHVLISNRL